MLLSPFYARSLAAFPLNLYKYKPTSYGVENNYFPVELSAALRTTLTGCVAMATPVLRLPIRPPCGELRS